MEFNVADLVEAAVDRVPDREILVCGPRRLTFRQLDERANRLAHHFLALGLGKGDPIGIYGHNSAQWVEAMLAAYKIRAVPINVNYRYVEAELRYLFDNADLAALVHDRQFAPRIAAVEAEMSKLQHFVAIDDGSGQDCSALGSVDYEQSLASGSPARDFEPRSGDDLYVLYTGGTTGMPKGVMWTHRDVIHTLGGGIDHATGEPVGPPEALAAKINPDACLVLAPLAPLMHGAAQWALLGSLFIGNKVVLWTGTFDPHEVWRMIEREHVQTISITGDAMARPLIEALEEPGASYDLSSLIIVASSAAIFSPSVKAQYLTRFPNLILIDTTGASEQGFTGMSQVTRDSAQAGAEKPGLRIRPGRDVAVFDEDLRPVKPGSGVIGKLARGGNVPLGYYKDPAKTAETFVEVDGRRWSIPGDFATVEEDGSIVMLGRGSVSINSGGEKIFPEEVESALKSHEAVFDALVVGVPDERWGSRVAAVVQPREGRRPQLEELAAHCRKHLAGYKVPRELHLVDELKRSPSGKPDYPWAQRLARSGERKA
jgi:acyl-CoA synthetase (AMP-forming)/AMP-acid ligase II